MTYHRYIPDDRESFLATRRTLQAEGRLGGSDIGTAAKENKYKCALRLYAELVGDWPEQDLQDKQSVKDGIRCEAMVADMFAERTGKKVHRINACITSEDAPHLFATIDRKVENEDAGLECKTANAMNESKFLNGKLPDAYARQVKTYMKVTGWRTWYLYAWVMGRAEYCYMFTLDDIEKPDWCDTLVRLTEIELDESEEIAADFIENHVKKRIAPKLDGNEDETALIREMNPKAKPDTQKRLATVTSVDLERMEELQREAEDIERAIASIKNRIKKEMGETAEAWIDARKVTWKNNKDSSETDWQKLARELWLSNHICGLPLDIIAKYTTVKPGARVLKISKQ